MDPVLTPDERAAKGVRARGKVPIDSHAAWNPPTDRSAPVDVLQAQAESRVEELVPIRYGRMLASPFAFFRGGAAIMASDLSGTPRTGLAVQLCGDAHLSNFGGFASPERDLLFDINDFDETLPGPFEWDVKRLAASVTIAGRERGLTGKQRRQMVTATVAEYRRAMREFAEMRDMDVWYAFLDAAKIEARWGADAPHRYRKELERDIVKARSRDSLRAFAKLTHRVGGELRIVSDPPLIVPLEELMPDADKVRLEQNIVGSLRTYRRTLQPDRRHLLEGFRYVHMARKVVGVGSVGTRAWIVLLLGRDGEDPLFLQFKEAQPSVLEAFAGKSEYANAGQRVVEGQRLMQAASDILLGWDRIEWPDGPSRDFYVRQLWDWKFSANIEAMNPTRMTIYGELCGWTLARAHARSGDRIAIATYLGEDAAIDRALAAFAEAYADQNERDHAALVDAVRTGRIKAETGV